MNEAKSFDSQRTSTQGGGRGTLQTPPRRRGGSAGFVLKVAAMVVAAALISWWYGRSWLTEAGPASTPSVRVEIPGRSNPANAVAASQATSGTSTGRTVSKGSTHDPQGGQHVASAGGPDVDAASMDQHPIDGALRVARQGLAHVRNHISDYVATIIKRERTPNGKLPERQVMFCKIRHRRTDADGNILVPFSIYLKFLEPQPIAGREVVWVENQNDGKLIAHEPGLKNIIRFKLDPEGFIAMMGQRYSLSNLGIENLIVKLIERGEQEREHGDIENCQVQFTDHVKLDGRPCTLIEIRHPHQTELVTCYVARIFFDNERKIPLRYAAFLWPDSPAEELPVDEEYTYRDVRVNLGLTDADFDPDNPEYDFP